MKISVPEAARLVGVSTNIVNALIKSGELAVSKETPTNQSRVRQYLDDDGVRQLAIFARAYLDGYSSEASLRIARDPADVRTGAYPELGKSFSLILAACFGDDTPTAQTVLLENACRLLRAECCLLITDHCTRPEEFDLDSVFGAATRFDQGNLQGIGLMDLQLIENWKNFTDRNNRPVTLHGDALAASPFVHYFPSHHLRSGKYYSLLSAPLHTRKRHLFGFCIAINREGYHGRANPAAVFDPRDEVVAEAIANLIERGAEILPALQDTRALMQSIQGHPSLKDFLRKVLAFAIVRTGAQRGDIAWLIEDRLRIVAQIQSEKNSSKIPVDLDAPHPSIMRWVYETRREAIVPNKRTHPFSRYYFAAWDRAASELTLPLLVPGNDRPFGVINLESQYENFFDERDLMLVKTIASQGALYAALIESRSAAYTILSAAGGRPHDSGPGGNQPFGLVLKEIQDRLGFEAVLLYRADYRRAVLDLVATQGRAMPAGGDEHPFDGQSIASKVFRENAACVCEDALHDGISHEERMKFDMRGSVLGVPLHFGPSVVGVMVVWGKADGIVSPAQERELADFGRLVVGAFNDLLLVKVMSEFKNLQDEMLREKPPSQGTFVRDVLIAMLRQQVCERARIWRYESDNAGTLLRFVCEDSVGIEEVEGKYHLKELRPQENRYTRKISSLQPQSTAVLFDPLNDDGPAREAPFLDRPEDAEWAVYPLFAFGQHLGHIACDNVVSRRRISPRDREVIALFGSLISQAIQAHGWAHRG